MTTDAVNVILDKAWGLNTHALIFVDDRTRFDIGPDKWDWKVYDDLEILCIYNKESNMETYVDTEYISEIIIKIDDEQHSLVKN
jgi:hypothetical protein